MTHLLGRQDCIDSLRRDLIDLQGSVLDVFSRTGPVKCPSWKFPDKLSCNLDLVLLLEKYDFAEGEEEFNQHTHIVLLELVIDRLMLLLQSFSAHIDIILGGKGKCSGTSQPGLSVSIGPVVTNFWNNLVQLGKEYPRKNVLKPVPASKSAQSQLPTTTSTSSLQDGSRGKHNPSPARRSLSSIPHHNTPRPTAPSASSSSTTASSLTHLQLNQSYPHLPSPSSTSSPSLSATSTPSCLSPSSHIALHTSTPNISADCHSVGCQTVESSLVPCDACAGVQTSLRESGVALVGLCEALGMPCSLRPLLAVAEGSALAGRLSACDVAQWASEQRKDLGRLATHHNEGMLDGLKERAKKAEQEKGMLQVQMEGEVKRRTRAEDERKREGEEWERRMREERRRADEERERLLEEVEELKKGAAAMEGNITELSAQLNMQSDVLHTVEAEKDALQEEVMSYQAQEVTWAEGEERRQALVAELSSTRLLLDKECAKYQSATRQHESLQVKQRALLERVDSLVSECEELQTRLEETEELTCTSEERDALQQQLTQQQAVYAELEEERGRLAAQVAELESTVLGLRGELREADHRERMLVAFPELNPLPQGAPQSTGDVLGDMEQQLQVNCLRICVLEKENSTLQTSLDKLRERGISRHSDPHQPPQGWAMQHQTASDTSKHTQKTYPTSTSNDTAAHSGEQQQPDMGVAAEKGRRHQPEYTWTWEHPAPLSPSLRLASPSSASSPPSLLHQQTLHLLLPPESNQAAQAYTRIRQAARTHSAGHRHQRK